MDTVIQRQRPEIRIDTQHSLAICDEIGWRLRKALIADYATLPHALAVLLDLLIDTDLMIDAPPLAPSMDSMCSSSERDLEPANA